MKTGLLGTSYISRSEKLANSRCVNLYPEVVETQDGKEVGGLLGTPGLDLLATVGQGPIRGFGTNPSETLLYVVSKDKFYELDQSFNATLRGTINTELGFVSMDRNATQMMLVDGSPDGWIYNFSAATLTEIADADFTGADQVRFIDQYFAFNKRASNVFGWTALADGSSVDALDIATAEGAPDNLLGVHVDHRELWLPGLKTIEVWKNTGSAATFERVEMIDVGAWPWTMRNLDNSTFWVDHDGIVRRARGYTAERVSTHAIERMLKPEADSDISDLYAWSYVAEGHSFYAITSPSRNLTVVYDAAASAALGFPAWHERAYLNSMSGAFNRHRANCYIRFAGRDIVGDHTTGEIYALDPDAFDDAGDPRVCLRSWRGAPRGTLGAADTLFSGYLHVDCEVGVGLATGQGSDPRMMLRVSRDGGQQWGHEITRSIGAQGKTNRRVRFGPLSAGGDTVFEIAVSDPVKVALVGAELEGELDKAAA